MYWSAKLNLILIGSYKNNATGHTCKVMPNHFEKFHCTSTVTFLIRRCNSRELVTTYLSILFLRSALLEKMPVMESKLSSEPVTNGEVPSQPEIQTKEGKS